MEEVFCLVRIYVEFGCDVMDLVDDGVVVCLIVDWYGCLCFCFDDVFGEF